MKESVENFRLDEKKNSKRTWKFGMIGMILVVAGVVAVSTHQKRRNVNSSEKGAIPKILVMAGHKNMVESRREEKIVSDSGLKTCVVNLARKLPNHVDTIVSETRFHSAEDASKPVAMQDDADVEETFIHQSHKVLRVSEKENQVAVVYADNMVVMVDGSDCRVTDIFEPQKDGSMHPRVVSRPQMSVLELDTLTKSPTSAPTSACRPNQRKVIRIVYQNRGGYDVTKVRFSVYNLAGQQLIPGGSVVKENNLRRLATHHIKKEVMWCWRYRVRIRIWIVAGDAKQENFWVSFRVWRKEDENTDPGEGGDAFCAYSQGTTTSGNDVKRDKSGDMPTTTFGSYDCSSYDHFP